MDCDDAYGSCVEKCQPHPLFNLIGNILPASNAAPALQGPARELEKHMRADSLEQKILHRPTPEELVKAGVLTEEENPIKD